jgi:hypothetical protein
MTYSYRAYGVSIHSDTLLPGLASLRSEPLDLALTLNYEPDWVRDAISLPRQAEHRRTAYDGKHSSEFRVTSFGAGEFFQLAYGDGTQFIVDPAAKQLWGMCPPPLTIEDLCTYLVGPIMGFILRLRSVLCLHASTVSIAGQAVALCGESQSGKSTTAAALALSGISVLAEDVTPVKQLLDGFIVEPGYPRICLWPDSVKELLGSPEALPLLTPNWDKRFLPLDGVRANFEPEPKPLGIIYLLAPRAHDADVPRIEDLRPREALLALVQNTYMNWLLNRDQRAAELDFLVKIVNHVPVRRIIPHPDPERLPALCELIVEDAAELMPPRAHAASSA